MRLLVATYNVQSFRAGIDRAVEVLEPEKPDFVMLQECGPRRILRRFVRTMGMEAVSSHRLITRVHNAVVYRPPWRPVGSEVFDLPSIGRTHPRGFVVAPVRAHGVSLTVVSAHLGLVPTERSVHARQLTDHLGAIDGPLILGVDVNEGPDGPAARWLRERLFDAGAQGGTGAEETFPAKAPRARIDYLLVNHAATVLRSWVASGPAAEVASDHRPVLAQIEVPG